MTAPSEASIRSLAVLAKRGGAEGAEHRRRLWEYGYDLDGQGEPVKRVDESEQLHVDAPTAAPSDEPDVELKHNTAGAVSFLKQYPGYPTLTAIHTDPVTGKKGLIETKAFPDSDPTSWIEARQGNANLYFLVNATVEPRDRKATKDCIAEMNALHVDVDVRVGEDQAAGIARIVKTFREYKTPPSFITSSGGGAQAFWLIETIALDGSDEVPHEKMVSDLELFNVQIERDLAGDHCHNIDRIMRLPGTINIPNEQKLKKGRKAAVAHLIDVHPERVYKIDRFTAAGSEKAAPDATAPDQPKKAKPAKAMPPILSLDDERLGNASPEVMGVLRAGHPTAPGSEKGGHWDQRIMGELKNRCGLPLENVQQVWKLSPLSKVAGSRPLDVAVERLWTNTPLDESDYDLRRMNDKYAVLPVGGKAKVVTFGYEHEFPDRKTVIMVQTFGDFAAIHDKYIHHWVDQNTGKPMSMPLGTWWLHHPNRQQYDLGRAFMPYSDEKEVGGKLNMYEGFGVKPVEGDCHLWLDFELNVVCSGDKEQYDYLMKREATIVQQHIRTEVTLALKTEKEGAGKGVRERMYCRLVGSHGMAVSNPAHVIGKFNPHLEVLNRLVADEALFVNNHEHRNALFSLTTEPKITIEPKFAGVYNADNYLNITLLTNSNHFVPASATARRFFIPTFSESKVGDFAYFNALKNEMDHGGAEALLYHLLHIDLTGFNVRDFPVTIGLMEQAGYSRKGVDALVYDACSEGQAPFPSHVVPGFTMAGRGPGLEDGLDDYIADGGDKELKALRKGRVKHDLRDNWGCVVGELAEHSEKFIGADSKEHWRTVCGVQWPPLLELRAKFKAKYGLDDWDTPSAKEWMLPGRAPAKRQPDLPGMQEGGTNAPPF